MRLVRTLLAPEVDFRISAPIRPRRLIGAVARRHVLVRGPRAQQRAVHTEVFVRDQLGPLGDSQDTIEEAPHDALLEQAVAIGAERRVVPHRLVHAQPDEPAIHHIEVDVFDQSALRANRKQALQKQGPQQTFRRNRRAPTVGVKLIELPRHRRQHNIGELFHAPQWVVRSNAFLDADIAEKGLLLSINATHFDIDTCNDSEILTHWNPLPALAYRLFQQPAKGIRTHTISADTLSIEALGEVSDGAGSDIALDHVELTSSGATRLVATGDISITPGEARSYEYRYSKRLECQVLQSHIMAEV